MTIPYRLIGYIAAALVLLGLIMWGPAACNRYLAEKQAHKIDKGQSEATLDALDLADKTEAERRALAAEIEAQAAELAKAIREAPAGDSNDAADRAVCQTRTYRETPKCVALLGEAP